MITVLKFTPMTGKSHYMIEDNELRSCFCTPIPEVFDVARFLDAAVSAHMQGRRDLAEELFRLANNNAVWEWSDAVWRQGNQYIQYRHIPTSPPILPKEQRANTRMPTQADKIRVHERDGYHCRFCGMPVIRTEIRQKIVSAYPDVVSWGNSNVTQHAGFLVLWAQYDHILPHSRGGTNDFENIILTCSVCNYGRMGYTLEEVGLIDPRLREPNSSSWDGLERFIPTPKILTTVTGGTVAENLCEGMFVELAPKPEYGIGKVLKVKGGKAYVFFRNQPTREASVFRLDNNHLTISTIQSDPVLDHLPPAIEQDNNKIVLAGKSKRWTLQQTIDVFHGKYPLGFHDSAYLSDQGERKEKWVAHELFVNKLGNGQGQQLIKDDNVEEVVLRTLSIMTKTKMLLSFEMMAITDALRSRDAAKRYLSALFAVLDSPEVTKETYQPYIDSVLDLPQEQGKSKVAAWPIVTLLPFIAQPERHMFLKPTNIQAAADALVFDLQYQPQPNWQTYSTLLEMVRTYFSEVNHLRPRDFIDIQSFLWIAGHE